jgi:hypothetical protein
MIRSTILFTILIFLVLSCKTSEDLISTIPEEPKLIAFYEIPKTSIDSSQIIFAAIKDGKSGWMNILGDSISSKS